MSSSAITGPIFTDVRRSPSGSAAAPSWSFNDSQGTGVYLVSANVLGLSTAGVQRVVVDSAGNVGIGTASPAARLEIAGGLCKPSGIGNSTARPALVAGTQFHEIRASGANAAADDGFLQLSAGGGTNAGTKSYIQLSGFSTVGDMDRNISFGTSGAERMRLTANGDLLVGTTGATNGSHTINKPGLSQNQVILTIIPPTGGNTFEFRDVTAGGVNGAATGFSLGKNSVTNRSINAGGSVNANGADYAEYMTKAGEFAIAKGDLCGVNAEGKLTNVFSEAVAFVVKSTNPSYVGGDSWGANLEADSEEFEAARQLVDRIAFCGQVPVNVLGATPGQWIIPVEENGAIKGQAVSSPSFEQYQLAVGKVIAIEEDGRARIIVKIA